MLPAKFLWGSVLLRGELQKNAKKSNFENFQSALYSTSVSMPLNMIFEGGKSCVQSIHVSQVGKNWVCICKFGCVKHSLYGWLAKPLHWLQCTSIGKSGIVVGILQVCQVRLRIQALIRPLKLDSQVSITRPRYENCAAFGNQKS